jgi:outer membrane autotransporter protein
VYGQFSSVTNETGTAGTILGLELIYNLDSVTMEITQGSFEKYAEAFGLTPNQKSVAVALDNAAGNRKNHNLIQFLDGEQLTSLPRDFDRIAPEELTSIFTMATAIATEQSINIQRRTEDIRAGSSGFSASRLAINGVAPSYSGAFDITSGVAGPSGNDGKESKEMKTVAPTETRWGAFLSGTGEWVNVSGTDNARGYDLTNGGFTLGVDYKVCPNFAVGLMAGYAGTTADLTDHGRVWVNGGSLGLYATTFVGGWYADAAVTGGYNGYDTRRGALEGDARGSTNGGVLNVLFGTGYDFQTQSGFTFGPTASFNYTYTGTSDFTEHGSLAPLDISGGRGESLRSAFGLKASYDWKLGNVHVRPEVRAAWQHEYGDSVYSLNSSFTQGADNFSVSGPKFGRDSLLLGAGFAIQCTERISTYFYYDGELGRTNYESNAVTGGIRVSF